MDRRVQRVLLADGDMPELERVEHLTFVDIDSGRRPRVSRPVDLARVLHDNAHHTTREH